MLEVGKKGNLEYKVEQKDTAKSMGSGTLEVLATPKCVALMEETAWKSVASDIEKGSSSVGTKMELEHISPTPVGETIFCESLLEKVEGRKLSFSIKMTDRLGVIAVAKHERFLVIDDKFIEKAYTKYEK